MDYKTIHEELKKNRNNRKHPVWKTAFDVYNNVHKDRLSMGCSQCYQKVYYFFLKKSLEQ